MNNEPVAYDQVVEANRRLLLQRSEVGLKKYGTALHESGLGRRELLQHALEEALDLANYLQAEIMRLDQQNPKPAVTKLCHICQVRPVLPPYKHCSSPQCIPY